MRIARVFFHNQDSDTRVPGLHARISVDGDNSQKSEFPVLDGKQTLLKWLKPKLEAWIKESVCLVVVDEAGLPVNPLARGIRQEWADADDGSRIQVRGRARGSQTVWRFQHGGARVRQSCQRWRKFIGGNPFMHLT